jgi:hypothetical protein
MRKFILIAFATLFVAPAAMADGEVYRWKDANGLWHYSDQPQPGAELVKKASNRSSSSSNSTPSYSPPPAPRATESESLPVSREVAQQVRQEAATIKADQCKKATENYTNTMQARRVYKTDEKGDRVFLNSAEIDAARLQARSDRDVACGSGS